MKGEAMKKYVGLGVGEAIWRIKANELVVKISLRESEYVIRQFSFDKGLSIIRDLETNSHYPMQLEVEGEDKSYLEPRQDWELFWTEVYRIKGRGIIHVRNPEDVKMVMS